MPLTVRQFRAGVAYWRTTFWPQDFHNRFYGELERINANRFTVQWWGAILPHLNCWKATRPRTAQYLTRRAHARLELLEQSWQAIAQTPDDIAAVDLNWNRIENFTNIIAYIKGAQSPVFRSKLCHFISPRRFPVTDTVAMGRPCRDYETYWNLVRNEWCNTEENLREQLTEQLRGEAGNELQDDFPFACKITEICLIGRHQLNHG